ncbi:MAG: hypothetical protein K6A72_07320 [Lachnospiraceae bacterium]|nr:hypothetical protein [Lachnospiraceae bacterium]
MNVKRVLQLLMISLAAVCLCGCGNAIPDLPEEDMRKVEEYAAGLLLKYDANYSSSMITEEEYAEEQAKLERKAAMQAQAAEMRRQEEATKENEDKDNGGDSGDDSGEVLPPEPVYKDIDEFFGISGIDIESTGYTVCDKYPEATAEGDWQGVVTASPGNKLVVFKFSAVNSSGEDKLLDMASLDAHFAFKLGDGSTKAALTTLLLNDLSSCRETLSAGAGDELVLLIEVEESKADVSSVTMVMRNGIDRVELSVE